MEESCFCHIFPLSFSTLPLSCFSESTRGSSGAWGVHSPVTAVMSLLFFFWMWVHAGCLCSCSCECLWNASEVLRHIPVHRAGFETPRAFLGYFKEKLSSFERMRWKIPTVVQVCVMQGLSLGGPGAIIPWQSSPEEPQTALQCLLPVLGAGNLLDTECLESWISPQCQSLCQTCPAFLWHWGLLPPMSL